MTRFDIIARVEGMLHLVGRNGIAPIIVHSYNFGIFAKYLIQMSLNRKKALLCTPVGRRLTTSDKTKHGALAWAGVCCIVISISSFLVSLGMPGVGWLSAIIALISSAALTPLIGKRYVAVTVIVSLLHLFVLGPLSALNPSMAIEIWPPTVISIFFVVLPFLAAFIAMLLPKRLLPKN